MIEVQECPSEVQIIDSFVCAETAMENNMHTARLGWMEMTWWEQENTSVWSTPFHPNNNTTRAVNKTQLDG